MAVAMLRHLLLERCEPVRIGGRVVAEQLVACAHRGFVARGMMRMAWLEREHEPVEETAAVAGRAP